MTRPLYAIIDRNGDESGPSPWWLREAPADVAAAWPVVRDLVAIGVTPVALDGDRITLAVEAIGGAS